MAFHTNSFGAPSTATLSPSHTIDTFSGRVLSSSISSFSSAASARHPSQSQISKTYKQASHLYLTRRLPEALSTLVPLITPETEGGADEEGNTHENGHDEDGIVDLAPVAKTARSTRVKVWCLYLTLLNAILELEPEEGKEAFGNQWRPICAKVRDGEVWEEVVRNGYHGVEGDVDSEVVISLATLLLAHARTQTINQKRLENYLAQCNAPNLDLSRRLSGSVTPRANSSRRYMSPAKGTSGANTPRDLNARVKILELYTLHVLIRNNEWDYAREFIGVSSVLDDERREAFLQALQSLQEDQQEAERQEREEREQQQEQLRWEIEESKRLRAENEAREQKRLQEERERRQGSEVDYGIDGTPSLPGTRPAKPRRSTSSPRPSLSRSNKKRDVVPTLGDRAAMVMRRLQGFVDQLSASWQSNPMALMRLVAFIMGVILMVARKNIRERLQRMMAAIWAKIRATAGMGVKVSYI